MCCIFCTVYRKSWYNPCDCSHVALFNYMTVLGLFINMIYLCLNMNVYTRYSSLIEIHHVQSMSQSFIWYMYIFFCIVWFLAELFYTFLLMCNMFVPITLFSPMYFGGVWILDSFLKLERQLFALLAVTCYGLWMKPGTFINPCCSVSSKFTLL